MYHGETSHSAPTQRWLRTLEKYLGWIAIPHIAVIFVTLQALGFLMVSAEPQWLERLALIPQAVTQGGEYWRLVTFLALPISMSPIWVIFSLWFLYFILNMIENEWGAFKTTLYVLISIFVTMGYSFAMDYPILNVQDFESTLFLAAAALYPEMEVRLFFAIPVRIKWLAWLAMAGVVLKFFRGDGVDRGLILAIYSNYLLFFGPSVLYRGRQIWRRHEFKRRMR